MATQRATKKPTTKITKPTRGKAARTTARATSGRRATPKQAEPPADALVGQRAPALPLPAGDSVAGRPYVLYFYPKDDTPGCTQEACDFRDHQRAFARVGVRIVGVSPDSEATHARFAAKHGLPFTLLSDPDRALARAYGVWVKKKRYGREVMGIERSTFVVDGKGVVRHAFRGVKVPGHVEAVLAVARAL